MNKLQNKILESFDLFTNELLEKARESVKDGNLNLAIRHLQLITLVYELKSVTQRHFTGNPS